jgi:hypothetical protein
MKNYRADRCEFKKRYARQRKFFEGIRKLQALLNRADEEYQSQKNTGDQNDN